MAYRYSEVVNRLLEEWEVFSHKYPGKADDRFLTPVFEIGNYVSKLRCLWLPLEYFWMPLFYEYDVQYMVKKKYRKLFKHVNLGEEMTLMEMFNIKKSSIVIIHPESLTGAEMEVLLGADDDRISPEWYTYNGLKRRCLSQPNKLINNPTLYTQTKREVKALQKMLTHFSETDMIHFSEKKMKIKNICKKYNTYKSNISPVMIVSCVDDIKSVESFIKSIGNFGYVIYSGKNTNKYKPYFIKKTMEKYKCSVIYLDSSIHMIKDLPIEFFYDFGCINASAYPVYSSQYVKEQCNDPNVLQCITTDILWFKNNFYTKNFLAVWDSELKPSINDRVSLSAAFNRYMANLWLRCMWFSPEMYIPQNNIFKRTIKISNTICESDKRLDKWNKKLVIYDDLVQCGTRPAVRDEGDGRPVYFRNAPLKKYTYKSIDY
jgi:hypothetical protein